MHLKSSPKLLRSELCLDAPAIQTVPQRSSLFVSQQRMLLRTPLSVLSTNTLRCTSTLNACSGVTTLYLKSPLTGSASRPCLSSPGCENTMPPSVHPSSSEADAPLDVWNVICPGHVREKIAIFASKEGWGDGSADAASATTVSHTPFTGLLRAPKVRNSREDNCSAKRRRRSGSNQVDPGTQEVPHPQWLGGKEEEEEEEQQQQQQQQQQQKEEEEQKVSVVEMVAFLEQRASEQQPDSKPLLTLQRTSTTITLSRAPPPHTSEEETEIVRVSDMVARLESESLRRVEEGGVSRSNSLRRTVGRVLLATGNQSSTPRQPSSPSSPSTSTPSTQNNETISCQEMARVDTPASVLAPPPSGETSGLDCLTVAPPLIQAPPPQPVQAEPLPGLLFFSLPPFSAAPPLRHRTSIELQPNPAVSPAPSDSNGHSEKKQRQSSFVTTGLAPPSLGRRLCASQDFLRVRERVQQLLEPQCYLSALPHHLLLQILRLLPTCSLAALKCSCSYFRLVIETYGVRPADSLWVSDPRYRDDPCKQCKKRYGHGDVSLCRWHHKPYCQALPYGPGYWMCCRSARRDAPGCNVGLHDNRWVPSYHNINVYRRSSHHDD